MNAERLFDSSVGDLLLTVHPLLRVLHGDKRTRLQRAFINVVFDMAARDFDGDHSRLPQNPKAAAIALHRAVIELCMRAGLTGADLVAGYNEHREEVPPQHAPDIDASIERCLALLSLFHARRIEAQS